MRLARRQSQAPSHLIIFMRTLLKRLLLSLLALGILGWLVLHWQPRRTSTAAVTGNVRIHIVANGWHAGIVLPAQALHERLPALRQRFPGAAYYEIGWGDVGFYRAKSITAGLALEALITSRGSVMHVVAVPDASRFLQGSDVASLCVDGQAYERMAEVIADSFARPPDGQPVDAGPGIYGDSQFYQANGSYHLLNTCNRWTASVLAAAGVDISPRLSLTAGSVLRGSRGSHLACPAP